MSGASDGLDKNKKSSKNKNGNASSGPSTSQSSAKLTNALPKLNTSVGPSSSDIGSAFTQLQNRDIGRFRTGNTPNPALPRSASPAPATPQETPAIPLSYLQLENQKVGRPRTGDTPTSQLSRSQSPAAQPERRSASPKIDPVPTSSFLHHNSAYGRTPTPLNTPDSRLARPQSSLFRPSSAYESTAQSDPFSGQIEEIERMQAKRANLNARQYGPDKVSRQQVDSYPEQEPSIRDVNRVSGYHGVHVTNLPRDIKENEVLSLFMEHGNIVNHDIQVKEGSADIFYKTFEQATVTAHTLHKTKMGRREISVTLHPTPQASVRLDSTPSGTAITNSLHVSNISYRVSESELLRPFSGIGKMIYSECRFDKMHGLAIIVYEHAELAQVAIDKLDGALMKDKYLTVEARSAPRPLKDPASGAPTGLERDSTQTSGYSGIRIIGLPKAVTEKDVFERFKDLRDFIQRIDRRPGKPYATIKFTSAAAALKAVDKVNNTEFGGRTIRIEYDRNTALMQTTVKISMMALATTADDVEAQFRHLGVISGSFSFSEEAETGYKTKSAVIKFASRYNADRAVGDMARGRVNIRDVLVRGRVVDGSG